MNIGDILHIKPTIDAAAGFSRPQVMPCTVIYIHPARRFYVVEFTNLRGQRWRETQYFPHDPEQDLWRGHGRNRPRGGKHYGGRT